MHQFSLSTATLAPTPGEEGTTNPSPGTHSYVQRSSAKVNTKVRRKFSTKQKTFGQSKVN